MRGGLALFCRAQGKRLFIVPLMNKPNEPVPEPHVHGPDCDHDGPDLDPSLLLSKQPYIREEPKIGRNDPCPCGSGKKHKKCCG